MTQPSKMYKVLNLAQTDPATNPPANFLYLFAREGKLWVRDTSGTEEMLGSVDFDGIVSIPVWADDVTYSLEDGDVYVLHNKKIWQLVAATSINEEPGVSMDWEEVDFSELSHMQNTDYKLGVYPITVQADDGIIDLKNNASFNGKNLIRVNPSVPEVEKEVTIITDSTNASREFYVVYAASAGSIKLVNDSNQVIGDSPLILEQFDLAKFIGNFGAVSGMFGSSGWTQLIASNKLQGGGGGGNPFDQSLNTTNNVQFAGLKLPAIAAPATETKAVVVDDQGNQGSEELKSINDVVFSQIKIIDQNTSLVTTWQVVDGVLTNVT